MAYFEDYGPDFHFFFGSTDFSGNIPGMHIHPHYEVIIVTHKIEQTPYVNGIVCPPTEEPSLTIFAPFTMHKINFLRPIKSERYVFYFGNSMMREFASFFQKYEEHFQRIITRYVISPELLQRLLPMLQEAKKRCDDPIFMKLNFLTMFYMILNDGKYDFSMDTSKNLDKTGEIIEYMVAHCRENLNAEDVAKHFFISRSKLNQDFKTNIQIGFHQLLMEMKLNQAFYMLREDTKSIKEIASSLGFEKENYFNTFFKRMTGMTPLQYKKERLPKHKPGKKTTDSTS